MNPHPRRAPFPPLFALSIGLMAVSTAAIFIRYAQVYTPSLVIAAFRLTIASVVLMPVAFTRRREELGQLSHLELVLALTSGFFLALHFATWITSLEYTSVASSVVLVTTSPLWVSLLSPVILKEPLTRPIFLGMVMALLGSTVIGLSDSCAWSGIKLLCPLFNEFIKGRAFLGDLLALVGAWMATGYLIIGRHLRAKMSLISYVSVVYGMAAVILIVIMFMAGQVPWGYPPIAYFWFLLLALVPQLLGHSTFNWALGYLSAAYVSITLLAEPIGSTILAYFFLNETPTAFKIFGAILILSGIYVATQGESRRKSREIAEISG